MMRFVIIFFLITSCANKEQKQSAVAKKTKPVEVLEKPIELTIMPGETRSIVYTLPSSRLDGSLKCGDRKVSHNVLNNKLRAFVSESYFSKFKPYKCYWNSKGQQIHVASFKIEKKKFPRERLRVNKKRVWLNKKDLKRVKKENKFKNKIYAAGSKFPLFEEPFELPIDSIETSIYGAQRVFNKNKKTQHLGTDFRAAVGTPIRSSNSGKIIAARDLFYTGGTIIVDHGMGIFTIYAHLSEVMVNEGDRVLKGQVIGLAGATGRVTGPHLHWGVKVNEMAIEGHSLISESREFVDRK